MKVQAVARELPRISVDMAGIYAHPTIDHFAFQPAVQVIAAVPPVSVSILPPVFQHTVRAMAHVMLLPAQPVVHDLPAGVAKEIPAAELFALTSPRPLATIASTLDVSPATAAGIVASLSSPFPYHVQREVHRVAPKLKKRMPTEIDDLAKQLHGIHLRLARARNEVRYLKAQVAAQASMSALFAIQLAEKDKEIADLEEQLRVLHASS